MAAPRTRELAVYDGQECIGAIKVAEDGNHVAFDPSGKRLGSFPSLKAASAALPVERSHRTALGKQKRHRLPGRDRGRPDEPLTLRAGRQGPRRHARRWRGDKSDTGISRTAGDRCRRAPS